jgi:hypothetical protein
MRDEQPDQVAGAPLALEALRRGKRLRKRRQMARRGISLAVVVGVGIGLSIHYTSTGPNNPQPAGKGSTTIGPTTSSNGHGPTTSVAPPSSTVVTHPVAPIRGGTYTDASSNLPRYAIIITPLSKSSFYGSVFFVYEDGKVAEDVSFRGVQHPHGVLVVTLPNGKFYDGNYSSFSNAMIFGDCGEFIPTLAHLPASTAGCVFGYPFPGNRSAYWRSSHLVITPSSLGDVTIGSSFTQAEFGAGEIFDAAGDGAAYSSVQATGDAHLYIHGDPSTPVSCVGASESGGLTQVIETPEGFVLGQSKQKLLSIYPHATYFPPTMGINPVSGYYVDEHGGRLEFTLDATGQTVTAIIGGSTSINPMNCVG